MLIARDERAANLLRDEPAILHKAIKYLDAHKESGGVSLEAVRAHDHEMIQQGHWAPLEKESNGTRN